MPKKLRIGLDIDDTLINAVDTITSLNNELYGTTLGRDDWFRADPDVLVKWGLTDGSAISDRVHELMGHEEYLKRVLPLEGAWDVLDHLKAEGHELFAVTSRPERIRPQTLLELEQCFPGIFTDQSVFMINAFGSDPSEVKITKLDVARQLELMYFVDDLLIHANAVFDGGIKTILFSDNYLWNKVGAREGLLRLGSWKEIGAYLDGEASS